MYKLLLKLIILCLLLGSCQSNKQRFEQLIASANEDLSEGKYDQALKS
jgi:hypothetical protein